MIEIVDYDAGNLTSVKRALDFLGVPSRITPDPEAIASADRVIFPGVGHAATAMDVLRRRGLDQALRMAFDRGTPILGICLGTQIILGHSEEGDTTCLGLVPGEVKRFRLSDPALKIPHMGWNSVVVERAHPVLRGVGGGDEYYFLHSFYPAPADGATVFATTEYEVRFASVVGRDTLIATQFHPEKSGRLGLQLLKNFVDWDGSPC